uniref:Aminotransferase class I/classII large domain-containing protein n=1 Tax=Spermophilus dauricus TaxID=99837 RepID=A0A8C9Q649_SPEDA
MLNLQQTIGDHFVKLTTRQWQAQSPGEANRIQVVREQEDVINHTVCQVISLLWTEAAADQRLHESLHSLNSREVWKKSPSPRQPDQPVRQSSFQASFVSHVLSNRGVDISDFYQSHFQDYDAYQQDKYHEEKNPLVRMGDSLESPSLGFTESCAKCCLPSCLSHQMSPGCLLPARLISLREEVARFLTYYCRTPTRLDPENVSRPRGGQTFLVPTPFYGGFTFVSHLYAKVELFPVHLESEVRMGPSLFSPPWQGIVLGHLGSMGDLILGLVLTNPQNPLGVVYSQESLMEYLEFAKRHNLHVIIDEIYMLSVFDESIKFHSVLSIERLPDPDRTHVIWGTSKDFGISGFCFGALYTHNKEVASAVSIFGYLHGISGITQYKLRRLLQDREWIDTVYLPANHSRLRTAHKYVTKKLRALKIPFVNHGCGLYVWVNLQSYLKPCTFEEERALHRRFLDNKLMLSRGKSYMCKEPGWFRIIFAENHVPLKLGEWWGPPRPGIL